MRHSGLYHFILKYKNPSYIRQLLEEESFYSSLWNAKKLSLIYDVGSNVGDKAHVFANLSSRVVCFEPDPHLAARLRIRFRRMPNVDIVQSALSRKVGTLSMHTYDDGSAYNTLNDKQHEIARSLHITHKVIEVPTITLDEEFSAKGLPDFLKIDVEGHEEDVFLGMSRLPRLLSFEANLPDFAEETCRILNRLTLLDPHVRFTILGGSEPFDKEFPLDAYSVELHVLKVKTFRSFEIFARSSTKCVEA